MRTNEPGMNITNQINAALNDIRTTLIALSERDPESGTVCTEMARARYELNLAMTMVTEHSHGIHQPWSDRKYLVEEEFS
jgi:hypothetical protein